MHKDVQASVFFDDIHFDGTLINDFGESYVKFMYSFICSKLEVLEVSMQCASGSIE